MAAHDFHENIGDISRVVPVTADELICVPKLALEGAPLKLSNIPPDEIVYANFNTVVRDEKTNALMIDAGDCAQALPTTEWGFMTLPPVMRVVREIGGKALDGFLVDYRRITFQTFRDSRLEYGTDSSVFEDTKELYGTVFPLGVLFNIGGAVEYHGRPELEDAAESMMQRVDAYIASKLSTIWRYNYLLPSPEPAPAPLALPAAKRPMPTSTDIVPYMSPQPLVIEAATETSDENETD